MIDEWFYEIEGVPLGPVTGETLRRLTREGVVTVETPVMHAANNTKWQAAGQLRGLFPPKAPPVPVAPPQAAATAGISDVVSTLRRFAGDQRMESNTAHGKRLSLDRVGVVLALAMSLFAVLWSLLRDPLGSGVSSYDLSTPKAAYISVLKMGANGDIRAAQEYRRLIDGPKLEEQLKTLEVR